MRGLGDLWDVFDDITSDAERASAVTCELCGEYGSLQETSHLLKTPTPTPTIPSHTH